MSTPILSASILAANFAHLEADIHEAEQAGVDWIHVDVMDGHFVPNISMGPLVVEACRKITALPLDVHLMIEDPDQYLEDFAAAGANRISVHIEDNPNIHRTIQKIRSLNCLPGIVLNPGTPAWSLHEVIRMVDLVLVMTVNPGYGGQAFLSEMIEKITEIQRMIASLSSPTLIQVDGGITPRTLPITYTAGARVFVAGNSIFKQGDGITTAVRALKGSIH
ncbi:ribulose-5-phosphate 3-epimerase [Longilinea arvoryzae]|uniref:Ribulose-phosphate 3-epimerase n=1 Tax=Longilinea arvoryzae TaxID=360412 RepID=A0A0S7BJV6_9CHLR|nr:ribulose-phosphate 3-epimerase [Longilinea arvoryzae]GAP14600.1 ribulose-5-phosphate 3-epimerase [Longilinea arvoryzae]